MIYTALTLLPASISFIFFIVYITRRRKSAAQKIMCFVTLLMMTYGFCDAVYLNDETDPTTVINCSIIFNFVGTAFIPVNVTYLRRLYTPEQFSYKWASLWIAPVLLFTASILINLIMYDPKFILQHIILEKNMEFPPLTSGNILSILHGIVHIYLYYTIIGIQIIWVLWRIYRHNKRNGINSEKLHKFFTSRTFLKPEDLQRFYFKIIIVIFAFLAGLTVQIRSEFPFVGAIYAIILTIAYFFYFYTGLMSDAEYLTASAVFRPLVFSEAEKEEIQRLINEEENGDWVPDSSYNTTLTAFREEMEEKKAFLVKDISIDDFARRIGSNRTYVSMIVNREYKLNFRDYVNKRRITYAKKYMKENPDATQEVIADECGYSGASSFNKKFTKEEGVSPRTWRIMEGLKE